jgi:hypothetical protein
VTTRLQLYQGACMLCGERSVTSLTENVPVRGYLDEVWAQDGVKACLEAGQWKFATRAQRLDYDPSYTAPFGFRRAFAKPTDWVLSVAVCQDEYYNEPLIRYSDEVGYWLSDLDQIFVKFVSNDTDFGQNLSAWPESFTNFVKHYFAAKIIKRVSSDKALIGDLLGNGKPGNGAMEMAKETAKGKDAFNGPMQLPPTGAWVRSRYGRGSRSPYNDWGNRNQLIG